MTVEKNHPVFEAPQNPNTKIWRYMDFAKYVSLLETQSLFFSRSDQFNDPYEGATSHFNIDMRPTVYKDVPSTALVQISKSIEWARQWTYINCWHMNNYESAAMWDLYAKSNEAIVIQSTFNRLCECLPEKTHAGKLYVGKVHYIDYEQDWLPENNMFYPFVHKRKSFEHEQELRAVFHELPLLDSGDIDTGKPNHELGRLVNIGLKNLIENIYVAPTAQIWFANLVKNITGKYGLEVMVTTSSLDKRPVF